MSNENTELQVQEAQKQEVVESGAERTRSRVAFVPRVDIYENDEYVFVTADMPGVDESTVDITLEKNVLTIDGYITPASPEGYTLAYAEYRVGDYTRSFTLSNQVDQERIEASVKDGVLSLTLPKIAPGTKRVAVKAG